MARFQILGKGRVAGCDPLHSLGANDGQEFATGGLDGSVRTFTLEGCDGMGELARETAVYDAHMLSVASVAIRGSRMASAALDGSLKLWDTRMGPAAAPREVPSDAGESLAVVLSRDASLAIAVGGKGTMRVVDCDMGIVEGTATLPPAENIANGETRRPPMATAVALDEHDKRAMVGGVDGTLAVVDVATAKVIVCDRKTHRGPIRQTRFSAAEPDIVVSGSEDQLISFFDVRAGKSIGGCRGHTGHVMCLDLSKDGNCIASGSTDRTVRVYDRRKEELVFKSREHTGVVWGVAYLQQGKKIVSVSDDGTFVLIDSENA